MRAESVLPVTLDDCGVAVIQWQALFWVGFMKHNLLTLQSKQKETLKTKCHPGYHFIQPDLNLPCMSLPIGRIRKPLKAWMVEVL